jgi:hypothetical protein
MYLREARNTIFSDAANTAIQLIEEADNRLISVLGVDNNESTTNITSTTVTN